jgi:protein-S-isoprenylcysteine O-methyltransferase Ste14
LFFRKTFCPCLPSSCGKRRGKMPEESETTAKILRRYFRDIRGKGKFSDMAGLITSGIILFSGVLVTALDFIMIQKIIYRFDLVSLASLILFAVGSAIEIQAGRALGKHYSHLVRILPDHKLIRHGVYKYIRHPVYLGELLTYFSIPLFFHSLYGLIVMILLIPIILRRIRIEEQILIEKFGEKYRDYIKNSKKLIPYVY